MALASGITIPLVVKIKDRARPIFKKHPFKSVEDDLEDAFSSVPYDVLHNEDIRDYIYCDLKDLGNENMLDPHNKHLADGWSNLKPEYKYL